MRGVAVLAMAVALAAGVGGCREEGPAGTQPQSLPTATIRIGGEPLEVEVADSETERRIGMMHRRQLGPDEAMLFVFPKARRLGFWMKNTYVDLDLAYIRADGTIAQVERLKAHDESTVPSRERVRFALEVPAGWLADHGVGPGTKVTIPPKVAEAAGR